MASFIPVSEGGAFSGSMDLASGQTVYVGDLVTFGATGVETIVGGTEAFCGVAAETPAAGASNILIYGDSETQFLVEVTGGTLTVANIGHDYGVTTTPGQQKLNLGAAGYLRIIDIVDGRALVVLVNHQFSSNEPEVDRVPEPTSAGSFLRKKAGAAYSWTAGVPTITGTTGHIPKIKADGTLETAGIPAANLQVLVAPAAANSVAGLTAGGALYDTTILTANVMRRPALATAGDVATMTAAKDAEGSGLQLNSVARRAAGPVLDNIALIDGDGDPTNSGVSKVALTGWVPAAGAAKTADHTVGIGECYIEADTTSNDVIFTLPAIAGVTAGKMYHLKKIVAANSMKIVPAPADVAGTVRVDGLVEQALTDQWSSASVVLNNSQWRIV